MMTRIATVAFKPDFLATQFRCIKIEKLLGLQVIKDYNRNDYGGFRDGPRKLPHEKKSSKYSVSKVRMDDRMFIEDDDERSLHEYGRLSRLNFPDKSKSRISRRKIPFKRKPPKPRILLNLPAHREF